MFPIETLRTIRWATCAVAIPRRPLSELLKDPTLPGLHIEGTGFLIRHDVVLTNRHVVLKLDAYTEQNELRPDTRLVMFIHSHNTYQTWSKITIIDNPEYDLALIGIPGFNVPHALAVSSEPKVEVGMEVGAYGYAYGESLMEREDFGLTMVYRFGPVLQQGFISGIAPYDEGRYVRRLLLDIRTNKGMSGAPVFEPYSGTAVGIHTSGRDATTAFAIPLIASSIDTLLEAHDRHDGVERLTVKMPFVKRNLG